MQAIFTRRTLWILIVFMILFLILGTIAAPRMIHWYASPFLPQGASGISCAPSIEWAMEKLVYFQCYSLALGLALGLVIAWLTRKKGV